MERTSWPRVVLVCAAGVPAAIALGKIALVGPLIRDDLGLSLPRLGWAISAITAVAALLGTPAGVWTRRHGARRTLLAGLAVMALGAGAGAAAWGLGALLAARVLEGLGYLLVVVAAPDLLVRLTRRREADRATALAGWGTVIPTGLAAGGAIGGLLAQAIGWRGWLGLTAALPLLAAAAVAAAIPPDPAGARPAAAAAAVPPGWRRGGLGGPVLLAGGFCGLCLLGIAVLSLLPTYLVGQRGVGLGGAGVATGIVALASVPGSLAAGGLLRRGVGLRPLSAAMLAMPPAALLAFGGGAAGVAVEVAAAAVIMLASGVAVAAVFAAAPSLVRHPGQIALAIGLLSQLGSVGTLLGAPLFGSVVAAIGWSAVAPLVTVWTLLSLALLLAASAQPRRTVSRAYGTVDRVERGGAPPPPRLD